MLVGLVYSARQSYLDAPNGVAGAQHGGFANIVQRYIARSADSQYGAFRSFDHAEQDCDSSHLSCGWKTAQGMRCTQSQDTQGLIYET